MQHYSSFWLFYSLIVPFHIKRQTKFIITFSFTFYQELYANYSKLHHDTLGQVLKYILIFISRKFFLYSSIHVVCTYIVSIRFYTYIAQIGHRQSIHYIPILILSTQGDNTHRIYLKWRIRNSNQRKQQQKIL